MIYTIIYEVVVFLENNRNCFGNILDSMRLICLMRHFFEGFGY